MVVTDGKTVVLVVLRGDHELNLIKIEALLSKSKGMSGIRLARDDEMKAWALPAGSLGPHQFSKPHLLVIDEAISLEAAYVVGANEDGFHFRNVIFSRDAKEAIRGVVRDVKPGESCVKCKAPLQSHRGIEVGHVFYLGTKYSKAMKLTFTSENGKEELVEMGCYGIGVGRTVAACLEQNHDQWGIIWPVSLAPYPIGVSFLGEGDVIPAAEKFYQELTKDGLEVLFDDRQLSAGVKLKDFDLVGVPIQLIVGDRAFKEGKVEIKQRRENKKELVPLNEAVARVKEILAEEKQKIKDRLHEVA